jgi:hypothetical protein
VMSKNIERFSPEFRQKCVDLVLIEKHEVKVVAPFGLKIIRR